MACASAIPGPRCESVLLPAPLTVPLPSLCGPRRSRHRRGGDDGRLPPALALLPPGREGELQHGQQHHPLLRLQLGLVAVPAGEPPATGGALLRRRAPVDQENIISGQWRNM